MITECYFRVNFLIDVSNDWALVATVSRLVEASGKNRGSFSLNLSVVTAVTVSPPEASLPVSTVKKFNGGVIQLLPLHASNRANRLVITVVSLLRKSQEGTYKNSWKIPLMLK